jgi:hypothetical protein
MKACVEESKSFVAVNVVEFERDKSSFVYLAREGSNKKSSAIKMNLIRRGKEEEGGELI